MMNIQAGQLGLLLGAAVLLALPPVRAAVPLDPQVDGPRAEALFQAGAYAEAAQLFLQLHEQLRHPILLKNAGKCHLVLGDRARAQGELRTAREQWSIARQEYAQYGGTGISEAERSEIAAVLVGLDDRLRSLDPAPLPEPPVPAGSTRSIWHRPHTYGLALAALGALAGSVGVGLWIHADELKDRADGTYAAYETCREPALLEQADALGRDHARSLDWAKVCFVGAGAAVSASVLLFLLGREPSAIDSVAVMPDLHPGSWSLVWQGSF